MRIIEVCCTSLYDVREAFAGGARRVELCEQLQVGGVTPSPSFIEQAVEAFPHNQVNVLVRPRGGSFVWNDDEIDRMVASIELCKELHVYGVVIGALTSDGDVDTVAMNRLMAVAKPQLSVTFHRAFDECAHPLNALEQIIGLGCNRLLTSGQMATAPEGAELLATLVTQAVGRIIIMPGSGVRTHNIALLEKCCGAPEYHSTAHGEDGCTNRQVVAELVERNSTLGCFV